MTTGLNYSASMVCIYSRSKFDLFYFSVLMIVIEESAQPGVLVVNPEGHVRHYVTPNSNPVDAVVELQSQVALCLKQIDHNLFLLSTTTSSHFAIEVQYENGSDSYAVSLCI